MTYYSFTTSFRISTPVTIVWKTLLDFPHWKLWWKGIREMRIKNLQSSPMLYVSLGFPFYVLKIHLQVIKIHPNHHISFSSTGDLIGEGIFILTEEKGMTSVQFDWNVATTKPWMNVIGKVAKPIFELSHNLVMQWFVNGLGAYLHTTVSHTSYTVNAPGLSKIKLTSVLEKE